MIKEAKFKLLKTGYLNWARDLAPIKFNLQKNYFIKSKIIKKYINYKLYISNFSKFIDFKNC